MKGFPTLGSVLGGSQAVEELYSATGMTAEEAHAKVVEAAKAKATERRKANAAAFRKWVQDNLARLADYAIGNALTAPCSVCESRKAKLAEVGLPVPEGAVFDELLPSPDRPSVPHSRHTEYHIYSAAKAIRHAEWQERQARRAARVEHGHQSLDTKSERRAKESEGRRNKRRQDSERAHERKLKARKWSKPQKGFK